MKNRLLWIPAIILVAGCASNEQKLGEIIKKNPQILFNAIEENPEQFLEVVNRAAQKAQRQTYEKQIAEMKSQQESDLKNPKQPALSEDRRLSGNADGKIVIVEYADFQCPACRMAYQALQEFKEKHKDQIQFYYKNMPLDFHKMAYPSALYFEAIRLQSNAKALKFYKYLFENQKNLTSENFLKSAAATVGANMKKLAVDVKSEALKKVVEADMEEFKKFGFTGTPVIILNGVALQGAQPLSELERMAELTLKK